MNILNSIFNGIKAKFSGQPVTQSTNLTIPQMINSSPFFNVTKNTIVSAVFCAVERISNSIACLPLITKDVHTNLPDDSAFIQSIADRSPLNMFNTMKYAISDMLLNGSGYVYIQRDARGYATALEYVPASSITVLPDPNDIYNKKYNINCRGIGNVSAENLLIFTKNIRLDSLLSSLGLSEAAKTTIEQTLAAMNAQSRELDNESLPRVMMKVSTENATKASTSTRENVVSIWNKSQSQDNRLLFAPDYIDVETLKYDSNTHSNVIAAQTFLIEEVARYFTMMPTELGDLSHSSYNTIEAASLDFINRTLLPIIVLCEQEINRKLLLPSQRRNTYIDLDESYLQRMDPLYQAKVVQALSKTGVVSTNDMRKILGLAPVKDGDKIIVPYTNISDNVVSDGELE